MNLVVWPRHICMRRTASGSTYWTTSQGKSSAGYHGLSTNGAVCREEYPMNTVQVALYARVSSEQQNEAKTIESQLADLRGRLRHAA